MRLGKHVVSFEAHGIPLLGNPRSGAFMGLTAEGAKLCQKMSEGDIEPRDVPESCAILVEHLAHGGYFATSNDVDDVVAPSVSSAYLHITQRCNLSCSFCYSLDEIRNESDDPSLEQLVHAMQLLASLGTKQLVISGGEPFLREDLPQLADEARRTGIASLVVLTNGLLCTSMRVKPLVGLVDCIAVAFDGYAPHSTSYLRGEQRFSKLATAVDTIRDCGIPPHILPTIHGCNLDDINRYQELASSLGATVSYSLLTAPTICLGDLALTSTQLVDLGKRSAHERVGMGDDSVVDGGMNLSVRRSCGAGARTLSIAADGSIYPCHMFHRPELAIGNGFEDTADDIMTAMMAHACASLSVECIDGCRECMYRYLCGGGCRARAYMDTGRLTGADPYCALYRSYYDACLAVLATRVASAR